MTTDNEIIKALKCCHGEYSPDCENCPNEKTCEEIDVVNSVIDLINRQKAEIKRLKIFKTTSHHWYKKCNDLTAELKTAKSEAIKEFAMRLKDGVPQETGVIRCADVDNLVKEMTEVKQDEM